MARRGFLAELQHQARVAARNAERAQAARVREHNAAVRRAEQAQKAAERAEAQLKRAAETERKRLEKEARDAHIAAMEAEVNERNLALEEIDGEIDSLLAATLNVDDFVDLEGLRTTVEHPPFDRTDLEVPLPPPAAVPDPPQPVFSPPEAPRGLGGVFGKKKHAEAVALAEEEHRRAMEAWQTVLAGLPEQRRKLSDERDRLERDRLTTLEVERARYANECADREATVADQNAQLDRLIANLGYGAVDAVEEYVSIVLSNSVYPDDFQVENDFKFDAANAELQMTVVIPPPSSLSEVKAYKYTKSSDEITATPLSQKACKDRYSSAVHHVALRSFHEVFEADRRGIIRTISLEVGTATLDPATGRETYIPFVAAAADREAFLGFDLSAVVPAATLDRLGASVSKNPYGLAPADTKGIRRS